MPCNGNESMKNLIFNNNNKSFFYIVKFQSWNQSSNTNVILQLMSLIGLITLNNINCNIIIILY